MIRPQAHACAQRTCPGTPGGLSCQCQCTCPRCLPYYPSPGGSADILAHSPGDCSQRESPWVALLPQGPPCMAYPALQLPQAVPCPWLLHPPRPLSHLDPQPSPLPTLCSVESPGSWLPHASSWHRAGGPRELVQRTGPETPVSRWACSRRPTKLRLYCHLLVWEMLNFPLKFSLMTWHLSLCCRQQFDLLEPAVACIFVYFTHVDTYR